MKCVGVLKEVFCLQGWEIKVKFCESPDEQNRGTSADCSASQEYLNAHINIYPCFWEDSEEEERKTTLVHEFAHILVGPYKEIFRALVNGRMVTPWHEGETIERLTTQIEHLATNQALDEMKKIHL